MQFPIRLFRTTSFRLTLFYAAVFGTSIVILLGVLAFAAIHSMTRQIDDAVDNEIAELQSAAGREIETLRDVVQQVALRSPGFSYLLQDASGHVLAGNMGAIRPIAGRRTLAWPHRSAADAKGGIRGRGIVLVGGDYLFVGVSSLELGELREVFLRVSVAGVAMVVALAIAGGLITSTAALRRVDAIDRTGREIMSGDLTRRIPVRGTGDEFDRLGTGLNAMLDRIQLLMAGLQQVSNDIAHDLRTPLTRLRQRLELAYRREGTIEGLRVALEASIRDSEAILETFGALLRIAQIESGSRRANFQYLALAELFAELVEAYEPVAEERQQVLSCSIDCTLRVDGDRELLVQLFSNLIENALQHAPERGAVTIEALRDRDGVQVVVADDGPGIPPEDRQRVLQRFVRLETSRHRPGTGLGLSLVAAIATLHGVQLRLEDNRPGLRCVLHFPAAVS